MKLGYRLDGHMVQGHVDQTGNCIEATETNGSLLQLNTIPLKISPLKKDPLL
jgi:riboflavin synthase alpha subunit